MQHRYFHFTLTCDAKRQMTKMILDRLVDEYVWQEQEYHMGGFSVKQRALRVRSLIEVEIVRRKAQREFNRLLAARLKEII